MSNINPIEAFSDPTRRRLLERLRQGPCAVNELVEAAAVSQPAVSQHLKVLLAAQLVQVQPQGQQRIYRLNPQGLSELRRYLESFWDQVLGAYQDAAAPPTTKEEPMSYATAVQPAIAPLTKSFVVQLSVDAAFRLFTAEIGRWWPLRSHSVFGDAAATCAIDAAVGGRIYETHADGRQSEWGRVLAWEPPHRLACTWHPGRGAETAQDLEVTFQPEGAGTRVTLTQTGWERLGEIGEETRANYDQGWDLVLKPYQELAAN